MKQYKTRKLNRLKDYDYSLTGYYYVTVCTNSRREIFGIIENDTIKINQYGKIVQEAWLKIPNHFNNIELDKFIIMPNHIHGILIIHRPVGTAPTREGCEAGTALSFNKNSKNNNLSIIIGSFKSAVSKQINHINNHKFKWQRSFYGHIIRTNDSLHKIREYIANNPLTWDNDDHNIKNCSIKDKACLVPTGQLL